MKFIIKYINIIFAIVVINCSCQPKIYSFKPEQAVISQKDTIKLHWKTRGKPILFMREKTAADDSANIKPGDQLIEFIMGFKHSTVNGNTRVLIHSDKNPDTLYFVPDRINGDSLIATGNSLAEDLFLIQKISTPVHRNLYVSHQGETFLLPKDGSDYTQAHPIIIEGTWRIALIITPEEKQNPTTLPTIFKLAIHKEHK